MTPVSRDLWLWWTLAGTVGFAVGGPLAWPWVLSLPLGWATVHRVNRPFLVETDLTG